MARSHAASSWTMRAFVVKLVSGKRTSTSPVPATMGERAVKMNGFPSSKMPSAIGFLLRSRTTVAFFERSIPSSGTGVTADDVVVLPVVVVTPVAVVEVVTAVVEAPGGGMNTHGPGGPAGAGEA